MRHAVTPILTSALVPALVLLLASQITKLQQTENELASGPVASRPRVLPTPDIEQTLWDLERAYWRYVQDNDLPAYLGLWDKDFLGWPSVNVQPIHKNHITDWITSQIRKGLTFKTNELKPAAIQVSGDIAIVCYWIRGEWLDKTGKQEAPAILRVTHTWRNDGKDWHIIGGMSTPESAEQSRSDVMDNVPAQPEEASLVRAESEIRDVENELTTALLHGDTNTLDRLYAASYFHIGADGILESKADRLAEFKSGTRKFMQLKRDDIRMRPYGTAAVVTSIDTVRGIFNGQAGAGRMRAMRVWVKQGEEWKLVAAQATALTP